MNDDTEAAAPTQNAQGDIIWFAKIRWRPMDGLMWKHESRVMAQHPAIWLAEAWLRHDSNEYHLDFFAQIPREVGVLVAAGLG